MRTKFSNIWLFLALGLTVAVFNSCNKDEGKPQVDSSGSFSKARIKDAKVLFINPSTLKSSDNGLLMKQMPDGSVEPVYFVLSNGDSLTCNTNEVISLNNEWIMLSGNYSVSHENYKYLFVNKNTETILGSSDFGFHYWSYLQYKDAYSDATGAVYLPTVDNLYKFNLNAAGNATAEKYLPDGEFGYGVNFFVVSKEGICAYAQIQESHQQAYSNIRFKLPSGKIVIMAQDFIRQNYTSDYISDSFIYDRSGDMQIFTDKNGKMYIQALFANTNHNFSFAIFRIDLSNNQLQYTKVAEKEVPNTNTSAIPSVGQLLVNPKKGTVMGGFFATYGNDSNGIFEFDGNEIQYTFTGNSFFNCTNFTANYLVDIENKKALNLNTYQEVGIQTDSRYDIKEYSFSRYSDNYSCKALEYETGKTGILECSVTGGILSFTPIENGQNITLSRIN